VIVPPLSLLLHVAYYALTDIFSSSRQDKITPLYVSAAAQHAGAVRALIEAKADVDFESSPGNATEVVLPSFLPGGLCCFGA
jgi:hypothetical protein